MSLHGRASRVRLATAGILVGSCALTAAVLIMRPNSSPTGNTPVANSQKNKKKQESNAPQPKQKESIVIELDSVDVEPMKYLPDGISLSDPNNQSSLMASNGIPVRKGSLKNIRALTDKERNGDFFAPRLSPDGLQMIVTRPGYEGVYLLPVSGGDPVFLCEGNAFNAKWSAEGLIEIEDGNGNTLVYGPDGTLESSHRTVENDELVFVENDTILSRDSTGDAGSHLTGNDDQYYNPVTSPNGDNLVYEGLHSGLHLSSTDGSGEAINLGPGNNPSWASDGSGFVFDRTSDDGHHLIDGDLVFVPSDLSEQVVLEDNGLISQMPVIGADGNTVYFEADGTIYTATIN